MRNPIGNWPSAVLLAAFASSLCPAQSPNPTFRVAVTHVKPDMLDEWMDLQRNEVIPALKKAGVKTRTTYRTFFGDAYEFLSIEPLDKYADFDSPGPMGKAMDAAAAARLTGKLRKCVASSTNWVSTRLADLSNPPETPMDVMVVTRYRIAAGKMADYQSLIKSEVLPVHKKAKVSVTVAQRGFGANHNDVGVAVYYAKMADLDLGAPTTRQLGADGAAKLDAKFVGIRTPIERIVRRRVADLSY